MEEKDIRQVADIEKEIFSLPWSENAFKDSMMLDTTTYLVAEEYDKILGYCGIYKVLNEGNITNVAVKEEYRRQGIAEKLLRNLIMSEFEKNIEKIMLEVRESNERAKALYMKLGFKKVGVRKDFYAHPKENAIIMLIEK